jgi:acetolactate synthase-1/3 small subunit
MQRVISFIVSNQPGVLCRISGLISRRGFNIESLTVGVTDDPSLSRITILMYADDSVIEQVIKQLDKQLDVKAIKEIPGEKGTLREIALVKVNTAGVNRKEFMNAVSDHWGVVLDIGDKTITVQFTGTISSVNEGIEALKKYGIVEIARTGMVALECGDNKLDTEEI